MPRLLVSMLAAATLGIGLAAQANPDLAGTWSLDPALSDEVPAPPRGTARGTPGTTAPPAQLTIVPSTDSVALTQGAQTVTFKLDGTETFWFQGGENRGTAAWEGGRLVISWKREFYAGPRQGYVTYSGRDVYSAAGRVLTVEKTTTGPAGTDTKRFVYTRSS